MKTIRILSFFLLTVICAKGMAQTTSPSIERWRGGFRYTESKVSGNVNIKPNR